MTAKELLSPRFEVISDYPFAQYKVGDILELFGNSDVLRDPIFCVKGKYKDHCNYFSQSELEKYPYIFRKLEWWEYRVLNQMPKRVTENPLIEGRNERIFDVYFESYIKSNSKNKVFWVMYDINTKKQMYFVESDLYVPID